MTANRNKTLPLDGVRHVGGLSLIEVLIALLVLSIGLVGMASLQLTSLKSAHSSYYRSLASAAALNVEERLWEKARGSEGECIKNVDGDCISGECVSDNDFQEVATAVQEQWRPGGSNFNWEARTVAESAGIPDLMVTFGTAEPDEATRIDNSNDGKWTDAWRQVSVTLTWTENRLGDAADGEQFQESFDYKVRIPCVPLFIKNS